MISNTPRVLCIHGLLGSGKSTAADHLENKYGFGREKFAGTLKRMIAVLLEDAGLSPEHIERAIEGTQDEKAEPIPELRGTTARHLMKMIGSEFRDTIYPELWMDTCIPRVRSLMEGGKDVALDDFRFVHEYEATGRELDGHMVYVKLEAKDQDKIKDRDMHQSERPLPDHMFDVIIWNNGTIEQLHMAMDMALKVAPSSTRSESPLRIEAAQLTKEDRQVA